MKKLGSLMVALLFAGMALAQQNTFSKVYYDNNGNEQAYGVALMADGNFMLAGERDQNGLLMKVDATGGLLWSKEIGNDNFTRFIGIVPAYNTGFLLTGYCKNSTAAYRDLFMVKVDAAGDTLWSKAVDLGADAYVTSTQPTSDHGFIMCGLLLQYIAAPYTTMFVLKTDDNGNLSWLKKITCANRENKAYSVKQMPDSGYIVMGSTEEFTGSTYLNQGCLIRLKADGTVLWSRSLGPSSMNGLDVVLTHNGFVCLFDLGLASGCAIAKTDFSGNIIWSKRNYLYSSNDFYGVAPPVLCPTSDGGFVYRSGDTFGPVQLVKVDSTGQLAWSKFVYLIISNVVQTPDSGILMLGNGPLLGVKTLLTTNQQIGIIKTDKQGNSISPCLYDQTITSDTLPVTAVAVACTTSAGATVVAKHPATENITLSVINGCVAYLGSIDENQTLSFSLFPNPASQALYIETENGQQPAELTIFDIHGQQLWQQTMTSSATQLNIGMLSKGLYFVRLINGKGVGIQKFVKE